MPEKSKTKAGKAKAKLAPVKPTPAPATTPAALQEASSPSVASLETRQPSPIVVAPVAPAPVPESSKSLSPVAATNGAPVSPQQATQNRRSLSPGRPTSRFQPTLPNLPPTPQSPVRAGSDNSAGLRKRKASQDLITNPLHKELKFTNDEPSQGAAPEPSGVTDANAERAKKKQNAITRTIWTLIMIFGFIGESLLLLMHNAYRPLTILYASDSYPPPWSCLCNCPRVCMPDPCVSRGHRSI